jgi:hypothetical protein
MNKILVSLAASLAVLGVVFAQVPGGPQEGPRPVGVPGQGGGMRAGGGGASVAASGNYVYVVSGNTLYQFSVDGLKLVAKTTLPTVDRGGVDGSAGRNGGGGRGQGRPDGIQK